MVAVASALKSSSGTRTEDSIRNECVQESCGYHFHVWAPNIYGTSSTTYLIIFLKVISKVLFYNISQRFTYSCVQLSIFLIDFFVGTYRLSSHARLEAFVIQTNFTEDSIRNKCVQGSSGWKATSALQVGLARTYVSVYAIWNPCAKNGVYTQ